MLPRRNIHVWDVRILPRLGDFVSRQDEIHQICYNQRTTPTQENMDLTPNFTLNLTMDIVPPVAKRGRHALILLENNHGKYLLGSKDIYPENVYRMIGGGIEDGEDALPAAARELFEETGLDLPPDQLKHLNTITAQMDEASTGKHFTFVTYLYYVNVGNQKLTPSDDIQGLKEMTRSDIELLITEYQQLPKTIDTSEDSNFSWYDYGQLYGAIHQIALDSLAI